MGPEEYKTLYKDLLYMHLNKNAGHIGGAISSLPLLYEIFSYKFNFSEDYFVMSKGHNASALYCVLANKGFLPREVLNSFYNAGGTRLGGHVPSGLVPFIPFATGSLGHGLSLAVGIAKASQLLHKRGRIYCLCGDGELQEGSCYEAINFAVAHRLNNLTIVIDNNGWQGFGSIVDVMAKTTDKLTEMYRASGVRITTCDGTDQVSIRNAIDIADEASVAPSLIIARTVKGKGMLEYEDTLASHYVVVDDNLYARIMKEL